MTEMMIEVAMQILGELVLALIGVAGAWVLAKLGQREKLTNIHIATGEAVAAAQQTAAALQQEFVNDWKAAASDGKLTESEVQELGILLLERAMKKLSEPAKNILIAAGKDLTSIIQDAAEEWILSMKAR